jgi:hypothetical protein
MDRDSLFPDEIEYDFEGGCEESVEGQPARDTITAWSTVGKIVAVESTRLQ